eukprot:COSAG05_NODE_446_length_9772_cov_117.012923_7_plen_401_part_00
MAAGRALADSAAKAEQAAEAAEQAELAVRTPAAGSLAGITILGLQGVRKAYANLGSSIAEWGGANEGDAKPETFNLASLAQKLQKSLYNEAFDDYQTELKAVRARAAEEGIELTGPMERMASVQGAPWWDERLTKTGLTKSSVLNATAPSKEEMEAAAKAASRTEKEKPQKNKEVAAGGKWAKPVVTTRRSGPSHDHSRMSQSAAWKTNAKKKTSAAETNHVDSEKGPNSLLFDLPASGEHPGLTMLPPSVVKHVTRRAAADAKPGSRNNVGIRKALKKMADGNWEERQAWLQYELKRPPSPDPFSGVSKVGRFRRWGRLGATSHLVHVLGEEDEEGGASKKDGIKKRESRLPPLPEVVHAITCATRPANRVGLYVFGAVASRCFIRPQKNHSSARDDGG